MSTNMPAYSLDASSELYKETFFYYEDNAIILNQYIKLISDTIKSNDLDSILGLGIGHSIVTNALISLSESETLSNVEIIEGSNEVINQFKDKHAVLPASMNLIHGFFENYESSKKFDGIEMGFVLEHVDDPLFILRHFKKFLNHQGKFFIAVPNAESLHRRIGVGAGLLQRIDTLSPVDYELGHKRYFTLSSLLDMIKMADLKVEFVSGLMLKPVTTSQMNKLNFSPDIIEGMNKVALEFPALSNAIYVVATLND